MRYRKLGLLGLGSSAKAAKGRAKKFVESRPRWLVVGLAVAVFAAVGGGTAFAVLGGFPTKRPGSKPVVSSEFGKQPLADDRSGEGGDEGSLILRRDQYFSDRRTAGSTPLDISQAGALRAQAALQGKKVGHRRSLSPSTPTTFADAWSPIGPSGLRQPTRDSGTVIRVSGRVGALAIRQDGTRILGAAGGGIWVWNGTSWVPKTDNMPSLHIGALAVAPSDDNVVYAGTGEGALSGDSYFGNGILKSTDGGNTWSHVSGDYFYGVSISRIVVDPSNANHLYAATLRGRGGVRRTSPVQHSRFGIWDAADCAAQSGSASVIEAAPAGPEVVFARGVYAAGHGAGGIFRSTDGGQTWTKLGYDQHPACHAVAFDPPNTQHVMIGSDGGVW